MDVDGRRPFGGQNDPSLNTLWPFRFNLNTSLQPMAAHGVHTGALGYNLMSCIALGSLCGLDYGGSRFTIKSRFDGDVVFCYALSGRSLILDFVIHLGPGLGIWKNV